MSLYDRVKSDTNRFLSGDDMQDVTLYNASGVSKSGKAKVTDVGFQVTLQGTFSNTKKYHIGFSIEEFSDITGANENYEEWQGEFINSNGKTIRGYFNNIFVDETFNYVLTNMFAKES